MRVQETDVHEHARQLFEAHGNKAIAEAARNAVVLEQEGREEEARTWRRIEQALVSMRGPRQS